MWVKGVLWPLPLGCGLGFDPLERKEVSLFVGGKRVENAAAPWVRPVPAPKSSSGHGCPGRFRAAAAAPMLAPRRRRLSCLRPLCRSPAPAYSSAAAAAPARPSPARPGSAEGRREGEEMSSYAEDPCCPWIITVWGCSPMGSGVRLFPSLTGTGKGQKRHKVKDTAPSAATPQTEPPICSNIKDLLDTNEKPTCTWGNAENNQPSPNGG